ncbi:MAG: hypothetical protein U0793_31110 [Gemmataceae bacterium]
MKHILAAGLMTLALGSVLPRAGADFVPASDRPAELIAAGIRLSDGLVVAEIRCGNGDIGQWFPGGRTATLEARDGDLSPWRVLWSGKLPDIGRDGYYIARPFATPLKVRTTFRLSISPGDRTPANDVLTKTFGPVPVRSDRIQTIPGGFKNKSDLHPEARGKRFP